MSRLLVCVKALAFGLVLAACVGLPVSFWLLVTMPEGLLR